MNFCSSFVFFNFVLFMFGWFRIEFYSLSLLFLHWILKVSGKKIQHSVDAWFEKNKINFIDFRNLKLYGWIQNLTIQRLIWTRKKKKEELFAEKLSFVIYFICLVCGNSGFKTWILGWFSRVNLEFFFNLIF